MKSESAFILFIIGVATQADITSIVRPTPTISAPPTITPPPKYAGDACAVSWIRYLESNVSFSLRVSRSNAFAAISGLFQTSYRVEPLATPQTLTIRGNSFSLMQTQCDGMPRVTIVTQTTITQTRTNTSKVFLTYRGDNWVKTAFDLEDLTPKDLSDPYWRMPIDRAPDCKIPENSCADTWEGLKTAMQKYVPKARELFDWSLAFPDVYQPAEVLESRKNTSWTNNTFMGNILIDEMLKPDLSENFLGGCIQPRISLMSRCWNNFADSFVSIDTAGLSPNQAFTKLGEDTGCILVADHGVLLYFPPKKKQVTRDLCANNGWGDNPLPVSTNGVIETAVVTAVTFSAHSFFAIAQNHPSLFDKYPEWKTQSVMKGRWTMTAGSVYLAINTVMMDYACQYRPYNLYSDIMLTMPTKDLSSLVANIFPTKLPQPASEIITARPFNLLDLEGPVPAKAWQMSIMKVITSFTITDGKYEPRISLPAVLADYHPEFASCIPFSMNPRINWFGQETNAYVWDPPVTLDGQPAVLPTRSSTRVASPLSLQVVQLPPKTGTGQPHNIPVPTEAGIPVPAVPSGFSINQKPPMTYVSIEGNSIREGTMTDRKGGIVTGVSTAIGAGQTVTIGTKTLSVGTNGVLSEGGRPVATVSVTPLTGEIEDRPDDESTGTNEKQSAAMKIISWRPWFLPALTVCFSYVMLNPI